MSGVVSMYLEASASAIPSIKAGKIKDHIIYKEAKKEVRHSCADVKKLFSILNV
jgi:hypothetical protein